MPVQSSHLSNTPIKDGVRGHWVPTMTPDFFNAADMIIQQKHHRRPDLLAHELYGNSKFWWVFALYNRNELRDPIWDFEQGMKIKVPARSTVLGV